MVSQMCEITGDSYYCDVMTLTCAHSSTRGHVQPEMQTLILTVNYRIHFTESETATGKQAALNRGQNDFIILQSPASYSHDLLTYKSSKTVATWFKR